MKTPERSVEEIVEEFFDLHFRQTEDGKSVYLCMTSTADDAGDYLTQTLQAERQKREEVVELLRSKRKELWLDYHNAQKWSEQKAIADALDDVVKALTQPNNPK